jgi:hypothetical protein
MLDKVEDTLIDDVDNYKDTNKELGNRVKQYTLVNKYFDNFLRVNKKQFFMDIIFYNIMGFKSHF